MAVELYYKGAITEYENGLGRVTFTQDDGTEATAFFTRYYGADIHFSDYTIGMELLFNVEYGEEKDRNWYFANSQYHSGMEVDTPPIYTGDLL